MRSFPDKSMMLFLNSNSILYINISYFQHFLCIICKHYHKTASITTSTCLPNLFKGLILDPFFFLEKATHLYRANECGNKNW